MTDERGVPASADETGVPACGDASGAFHTKRRVMIVDDDGGMARQLALALEFEGVQVETVSDADEALSSLERAEAGGRPTDLVLIELMLPRRSGLELARELRTRYPNLPVVLTGSYHLSERQLSRAGCNAIAFVPKPCDPAVVAAFVKGKVAKSE